ncbi:polyprenol dehydrogenase-like [Antedon mediterranea]|uniref:polyprenol dehydrogenase-like n=1 Tax=Antedon mediterranea TaxID=105859 RepID=UPI003AF93556
MAALLREFCTILHVHLIAVFDLIRQLFTPHCYAKGVVNQNGHIAIVTGGASGIGFETTKKLCTNGMRVFIASRSEEEANDAIERIRRDDPEASVEWMYLDLASLMSVRRCASTFKSYDLPLHVLVNNAGVMIPPFMKTEDGFELQFQVNYLGHFLLTLLLSDLLIKTGVHNKCARIVNVSSVAHICEDLDMNNLIDRTFYGKYSSYSNSKFAIILSSYRLHQKLMTRGNHVTVNCVHPGVVNSELFHHYHWALQPLRRICAMLHVLKTPEEGSETSVYVALSTELEGNGGLYFANCVAEKSSSRTYDKCLQNELWDRSIELASVTEKELFYD